MDKIESKTYQVLVLIEESVFKGAATGDNRETRTLKIFVRNKTTDEVFKMEEVFEL